MIQDVFRPTSLRGGGVPAKTKLRYSDPTPLLLQALENAPEKKGRIERIEEAQRARPDNGESSGSETYNPVIYPSEWSTSDPGYAVNPFEGMQVPGWFQSEHVDKESDDKYIREMNRRLWAACDDGDIEEVEKALQQGAEVATIPRPVELVEPHTQAEYYSAAIC